jgi:hypothetical protein
LFDLDPEMCENVWCSLEDTALNAFFYEIRRHFALPGDWNGIQGTYVPPGTLSERHSGLPLERTAVPYFTVGRLGRISLPGCVYSRDHIDAFQGCLHIGISMFEQRFVERQIIEK